MTQFQGPALYAYNDAMFSDEDWRGIKMLQDSIKKDDPLKVGRFGLGFKSVFHMTGKSGYNKGPFPANRAAERIPLKYMGPPAAADPLAVAARI